MIGTKIFYLLLTMIFVYGEVDGLVVFLCPLL